MKSRLFSGAVALFAAIGLAACGGSSPGPVSNLTHRVFVSNALAAGTVPTSALQIIDYQSQAQAVTSIPLSTSPGGGLMALSSDHLTTFVFVSSTATVEVVDNKTEAVVGSVPLAANVESMVPLPDNQTLLVSMRNAPVAGSTAGVVDFINYSTNSSPYIAANVNVPEVRKLVISPDGTKALAFSDNSNSVNVIDTSAKTATAVAGFDAPVYGVFSSDGTKAYIMNCGPECGGVQASVSVLAMAGNSITGTAVPVSAATVGAMDASGNLYVAGTANGLPGHGLMDVVSTSSMTVSKSAIPISDGSHTLAMLGPNNKLFIGAQTCTSSNCLTIVDTGSQTAVVNPCNGTQCATGNVTGMQPLTARNEMYVVAGGGLHIFDDTQNPPLEELRATVPVVVITGQAIDVRQIDP